MRVRSPPPAITYDDLLLFIDWPMRANRRRSRGLPIRPIECAVATAPIGHRITFNWRSFRSGLKWIVFSPLMFLWAAMADRTASDVEYEIQIILFGAWSVIGVVSGIGTITGASWAAPVQRVLMWILIVVLAFCVVALLAIAFYSLAR